MLSGVLSHLWPYLHCQVNFVRALVYALERHLPPRFAATFLISSILPRSFSAVLFFAQIGHHFPIYIFPGVDLKQCPSSHSHSNLVLVLMYFWDMHRPFHFFARRFIVSMLCLVFSFAKCFFLHSGHQRPPFKCSPDMFQIFPHPHWTSYFEWCPDHEKF
jgi:hypothetical protein